MLGHAPVRTPGDLQHPDNGDLVSAPRRNVNAPRGILDRAETFSNRPGSLVIVYYSDRRWQKGSAFLVGE